MSGVYYYKSFTAATKILNGKFHIERRKYKKKKKLIENKKENCLKLGQIVHFYSSLVSLS